LKNAGAFAAGSNALCPYNDAGKENACHNY
jgi:hypothetical protein